MKLNRMLLVAGLLFPGAVLAQDVPMAEVAPDESELSPIGWKKTLGEARQAASARNGYALILVTGANPASERIDSTVLWWPPVMERLQEDYGCVKGTVEELGKDEGARAKLSAAGVTEGPALILIEPADGSIVDVTKGELTPRQAERLLQDVDKGLTQKGLEDRSSRESGNPEFRLALGLARMRKADAKGAGEDFEAALKSEDPGVVARGKIGLAAVAMGSKDCGRADRLLGEAMGLMVEEKEAQDFESPMAEALRLLALSAWEQDLREDATRHARKLMETWPMSSSMELLRRAGQDMEWDWYEGVEVAR